MIPGQVLTYSIDPQVLQLEVLRQGLERHLLEQYPYDRLYLDLICDSEDPSLIATSIMGNRENISRDYPISEMNEYAFTEQLLREYLDIPNSIDLQFQVQESTVFVSII